MKFQERFRWNNSESNASRRQKFSLRKHRRLIERQIEGLFEFDDVVDFGVIDRAMLLQGGYSGLIAVPETPNA